MLLYPFFINTKIGGDILASFVKKLTAVGVIVSVAAFGVACSGEDVTKSIQDNNVADLSAYT